MRSATNPRAQGRKEAIARSSSGPPPNAMAGTTTAGTAGPTAPCGTIVRGASRRSFPRAPRDGGTPNRSIHNLAFGQADRASPVVATRVTRLVRLGTRRQGDPVQASRWDSPYPRLGQAHRRCSDMRRCLRELDSASLDLSVTTTVRTKSLRSGLHPRSESAHFAQTRDD